MFKGTPPLLIKKINSVVTQRRPPKCFKIRVIMHDLVNVGYITIGKAIWATTKSIFHAQGRVIFRFSAFSLSKLDVNYHQSYHIVKNALMSVSNMRAVYKDPFLKILA